MFDLVLSQKDPRLHLGESFTLNLDRGHLVVIHQPLITSTTTEIHMHLFGRDQL